MFGLESKRIDLSGRKGRPGASATALPSTSSIAKDDDAIVRARMERAAQRAREGAAVRLQALVRARLERTALRAHWRSLAEALDSNDNNTQNNNNNDPIVISDDTFFGGAVSGFGKGPHVRWSGGPLSASRFAALTATTCAHAPWTHVDSEALLSTLRALTIAPESHMDTAFLSLPLLNRVASLLNGFHLEGSEEVSLSTVLAWLSSSLKRNHGYELSRSAPLLEALIRRSHTLLPSEVSASLLSLLESLLPLITPPTTAHVHVASSSSSLPLTLAPSLSLLLLASSSPTSWSPPLLESVLRLLASVPVPQWRVPSVHVDSLITSLSASSLHAAPRLTCATLSSLLRAHATLTQPPTLSHSAYAALPSTSSSSSSALSPSLRALTALVRHVVLSASPATSSSPLSLSFSELQGEGELLDACLALASRCAALDWDALPSLSPSPSPLWTRALSRVLSDCFVDDLVRDMLQSTSAPSASSVSWEYLLRVLHLALSFEYSADAPSLPASLALDTSSCSKLASQCRSVVVTLVRRAPRLVSSSSGLVCLTLRVLTLMADCAHRSRWSHVRLWQDDATLGSDRWDLDLFTSSSSEEESDRMSLSASTWTERDVSELIVTRCPFLISPERKSSFIRAWQSLKLEDEATLGGERPTFPVRRGRELSDALSQIMGSSLAYRAFRVEFINEGGAKEHGFGPGVLKEFLILATRELFLPSSGYFTVSSSAQQTVSPVAPSPSVLAETLRVFTFAGALLARLVIYNVTVDVNLDATFLSQLLPSESLIVPSTLHLRDLELWGNLRALLGLSSAQLAAMEIEDTDSTSGAVSLSADGVRSYIARYAERLTSPSAPLAAAFRSGLVAVLPSRLLDSFLPSELAQLLQGEGASVDVDDLERHTRYANGFHAQHSTVLLFWAVVRAFDQAQLRALLQFVTATSRPPSEGFRALQPQFCLQQSALGRLPSATTCSNILKLPPYRSAQELREALLYSIFSKAGFDLS